MTNNSTAVTPDNLPAITHAGRPVVTTALLAKLYGTDDNNLIKNFQRNTDRFVAGKHFHKLEGAELKALKDYMTNSHVVQIPKNTRQMILWTERGAARHAKMLDTDQAWEVFEKLEDSYFGRSTPLAIEHKPESLTPAHQRHVLDRVAELAGRDRKKFPTVWRSIKAHFKVASYKQIPDSQYPALCEFMMCKPLGGEYLPKQEDGMLQITEQQAVNLSHLLHSVAWVNHKWHQGICQGLQYLNRDMYAGTFEHFDNMRRAAIKLDASLKDLLEDIDQRHKLGGRRPEEMSIAA